jgi:hypothetical protein
LKETILNNMTSPIKLSRVDLLLEILKDPDRKTILRILFEFFYLFIIYRELPKHYFSRYLFKRGITNIKDYLPNKFLGEKVTPFFNDKKFKEVLDNKLYFDLYYRQFNISLPKILMYNHKKNFILGTRSVKVSNIKDFNALLDEIFAQNPQYDSIFIKKTYSSSSGQTIYKLYRDQFRNNPEIAIEIFEEVIRSEFLFQETIKQHPAVNKLNPASVNTIRIDTFVNKDGKIDIVSAHIRMSTNNSYVDNISAGGCFVGVGLQTGQLKKTGYSSIKFVGAKVFKEHPVTKSLFDNFSIPYFNEVEELVIKAAGLMAELRLVGWDVAIGETGPILVEGNSDYEIRGNDFAYGGYLANPIFRKVLHEINYL